MELKRDDFHKLDKGELLKKQPRIFMDSVGVLDDGETVFFARELEYIKAKTYDVQYPELMARMLFSADFATNPGAETITYDQWDRIGQAKIINSYADDFPKVSVKAKQFTSNVKGIGASYDYNVQEIRAASMANKPLQQRKANATRIAHFQEEHRIAMFGDAAYNLPGFLSNTNINTGTVTADGVGVTTTWSTKTADQILRDMDAVLNVSNTNTKGIIRSNRLLLPQSQYATISSLRVSDTQITVLQFFLTNHPGVEVMPILDLDSAEYPAALGFTGDLIVAYNNSPDYLTMDIPQEFEQFPPERKRLTWEVSTHARFGGVIIYYPLSVTVYDGI